MHTAVVSTPSRPVRTLVRRLVPVALVAIAVAGCARPAGRMTAFLDGASQARLDAAVTPTILMSLKGLMPLESLPPLGEGGRVLGRAGTSVLLEVPRETLSRLADLDGVSHALVWGDANAAGRLDPGLRTRLLEAVDAPARATEPISMIATFRQDTGDLRERLEGLGAAPRTVAGTVVTLDAAPEAVFRILALPDLASLSKPRELYPLGGGQ